MTNYEASTEGNPLWRGIGQRESYTVNPASYQGVSKLCEERYHLNDGSNERCAVRNCGSASFITEVDIGVWTNEHESRDDAGLVERLVSARLVEKP